MPLPSTTVIPARWAEHHRAAAEATMQSTVRLLRADSDRKNDAAAWQAGRRAGQPAPATPPPAAGDAVVVYDGPAYIEAAPSGATSADVADQNVTVRNFLVSLPLWAPPVRAGRGSVGDRLVVDANPGDPDLVGRKLRVVEVAYGSQSWSRDVVAAFEVTENNPPPASAGTVAVTGPPTTSPTSSPGAAP